MGFNAQLRVRAADDEDKVLIDAVLSVDGQLHHPFGVGGNHLHDIAGHHDGFPGISGDAVFEGAVFEARRAGLDPVHPFGFGQGPGGVKGDGAGRHARLGDRQQNLVGALLLGVDGEAEGPAGLGLMDVDRARHGQLGGGPVGGGAGNLQRVGGQGGRNGRVQIDRDIIALIHDGGGFLGRSSVLRGGDHRQREGALLRELELDGIFSGFIGGVREGGGLAVRHADQRGVDGGVGFRLAGDGQRIAGHFAGRIVRKGQTAGPFRSVLDFREDETVDDLVHKFRVPVLGGAAGDLEVKGDGIAVSDRAALIAPHDQGAVPGQGVFQLQKTAQVSAEVFPGGAFIVIALDPVEHVFGMVEAVIAARSLVHGVDVVDFLRVDILHRSDDEGAAVLRVEGFQEDAFLLIAELRVLQRRSLGSQPFLVGLQGGGGQHFGKPIVVQRQPAIHRVQRISRFRRQRRRNTERQHRQAQPQTSDTFHRTSSLYYDPAPIGRSFLRFLRFVRCLVWNMICVVLLRDLTTLTTRAMPTMLVMKLEPP